MIYGCHNRPRPVAGATLSGSKWYGSQTWKFVNSTECKHDKRATDSGCKGCRWACPNHRPITQHLGDGTPLEYCPECGRNEITGTPYAT